MPLKIRWVQKDYFSIGLMLFGACGLFQALIIFIAQFFFSIGNYLVIILIPIGVTIALFYCTTIIYDSFSQVERRKKISKQFQKFIQIKKIKRILLFPIARPILIVVIVFITIFFSSYFISFIYLNNIYSFIIAENLATIICLLTANAIEKNYAKVVKY
jgi:hypothetical protein